MSLASYLTTKDSGITWIGQVPSHWEVLSLKRAARLVTVKAEARRNPVALENIESWTGRFIGSEGIFEGEGIAFDTGDVLFGKLRPYLAKVLHATCPGEAVGDLFVVRPQKELNSRFLAYYMRSREFIDIVDGSTFGSKMPRASWDFVGGMPVTLPPLDEQIALSDFLDRETAKIDALVREQLRLVELLSEKRQAVISQAVTKGISANVPARDSVVPWIGMVPSHWKITRLKHVVPQVTVGIVVEPSKYYTDSGVPALRSLNVRAGAIDMEGLVHITPEGHKTHQKSRIEAGDLVAVRSGQPGTTAVVPSALDDSNCVDLIVIRRPQDGSEHFLCWFLNSDAARAQYSQGSGGAIQQHFNVEAAANLLVTWPPTQEQKEIADYLERVIASIDELIEEARRLTDILAERRSALIASAVTGKIDVRGLVDQATLEAA